MGEDADEIRREIEATRARMSETVEAIGYKADIPSRLRENVNERIDSVKGTIGEAVGVVKGTFGEAVGGMKGTLGDAVGGAKGTLGDATGGMKGTLGDAAGGMKGTLGSAAGGVRGKFGDAVGGVKDTLGGAVGGVMDTARNSAQKTGDSLSQASGSARQAVSAATENPLGIGLGALALGLIAGLVFPITDIERERIGPVRDQIAQRAQAAASEAVEAGKAVLNETLSSAASSAQQHGREVAEHAVAGTPLEQHAAQSSG